MKKCQVYKQVPRCNLYLLRYRLRKMKLVHVIFLPIPSISYLMATSRNIAKVLSKFYGLSYLGR